MCHRKTLVAIIALTVCLTASVFAVPSYRSFIEWDGPYYHVRHAQTPDSSAYFDYLVNTPLPFGGSPFSSPTAVALFENAGSTVTFVVDHDHQRVQLFNANALWKVESLTYSSPVTQGYFGGTTIKFSLGNVIAGSELISINGIAFKRVSSLTGYTVADSVYTMTYFGLPNTGGVATLPTGWSLTASDSVRVEYGYAWPAGAATSVNDIDYVLTQTLPTDLPMQLDNEDFTTDPEMSDLTSIAVNGRVGGGVDMYLVNGLSNGAGSLASYSLTTLVPGSVLSYVDVYPGPMGRPYDVEIEDRGANTPGTIIAGVPVGVNVARLTVGAVTNQNTFLGHNYSLTYSIDTVSTMNQVTPTNVESDIYFDATTGKLHMVYSTDAVGVRYTYSNNNGKTWATPVLLPAPAAAAAKANVGMPRIVVLSTGQIHVVYEAGTAGGVYKLYHTVSSDGILWSAINDLTTTIAAVTSARYPNLLVEPGTSKLHLIFAGDDDVYELVYNDSWSAATLVVAATAPGTYSAPHAIMSPSGRIYCAYASAPNEVSYILFNGSAWGSYVGGGNFVAGSPDPVTPAAAPANAGWASSTGAVNYLYPCPQVALEGDVLWVFWAGNGVDVGLGGIGATRARLYYNKIVGLSSAFTAGAGTAIVPATDDVAPMHFAVAVDADSNIHVVYPYAVTTPDAEGLRYKVYKHTTGLWSPVAANVGRNIYAEGAAATASAAEPRLIVPVINGQNVPMLACAKEDPAAGFGTRILYKIIDGALIITDETAQATINMFRVWTTGIADAAAIPGVSFTITNTDNIVTNTEDGAGAVEYGVNDVFELTGTAAVKNDLLFVSDSDNDRVKVIRAYDNIANCFAGGTRWDVPGISNGSNGQTFQLATTGTENSFTVWASPDATPWTIVDDLLIAGPTDRKCEVNRYTHEIRFGDNVHGKIPLTGTMIRVRYEESVDEAEFGTLGTGAGQMNHPHGLAVRYNSMLGQYDLYIADTDNNRLSKYAYRPDQMVSPDLWATPVVSWNTASSSTDVLANPEDIEVVTYSGKVYLVVSDRQSGSSQDLNHSRILIYCDNEATGNGGNAAPTYVTTIGQALTNSLNGFVDPRGLAVTSEDSGLVILATDADRNMVAKIMKRDWLVTTSSSGGGTDTTGTDVNTLLINDLDATDNDNYLLMQPGASRIVEIRMSQADSLMAVHISGTFPKDYISIESINEGNLWGGEPYTNKLFLFSYDNAAGTFDINTSMVGDPNGLTSSATRVLATIVIHAAAATPIPSSGMLAFVDSLTEIRTADNHLVSPVNSNDLHVLVSYLADIATPGADPGRIPNMIPVPDGKIDFADVNLFTQGWNGNGIIFDPLADIGPYTGTTVPALVSNADGKLDAYDLLALSTMYNWYNTAAPMMTPPPRSNESTLDETHPIVAVDKQTEHGWTVEIQVRDITNLTSAHLFLEVQNAGGTILNAHEGGFLKSDGNTIFLSRLQSNLADLSIGRLCREHPSVSGSGTLATFELNVPNNEKPKIRLVYELRNNGNHILSTAELTNLEPEAIPTQFSLGQVYPNPFNSSTTFTMNLPEATMVSLRVFNMLGQEIGQIVKRQLPAGVHHMVWEARDNNGMPLPTGLYFARMEAAGKSDVVKVMLLR